MKNIILAGTGVAGLFLGVAITRVIGMADGLGMGIGMMAGIIIGMFVLLPCFEKYNKKEPEDN